VLKFEQLLFHAYVFMEFKFAPSVMFIKRFSTENAYRPHASNNLKSHFYHNYNKWLPLYLRY